MDLKKELMSLYPNKKVSKINKDLYSIIYRTSVKENKSVSDFLDSLGFVYEKKDDKFVEEQLKKLYPDKVVKKITSHTSIYGVVLYQANKAGITVAEYIKNLGYSYCDGRKTNGIKDDVDIEKETEKQKLVLSKMFKNKVVKSIFKSQDQKLYYWIRKIAKLKNQTIEIHLAEMGFQYMGGKIEEKDIADKLEKIYPNRIIQNCSKLHPKINSLLKRKSKQRNISIEQYCKNIGFDYIKTKRQTIENAEEHLLEIYPNRVVDKSLVLLNRNLYCLIALYAKKQKLTVMKYIESLGFSFSKKRERIRNMDLEQELLKYYPNRKVEKIRDMDVQLYQRILRRAKLENKRVSVYLKKLGFKYVGIKKKIKRKSAV